MDSVVTGRIEYPFDGTQFANDTRVEPKLINQVELMVDYENHGGYKQSHGPEYDLQTGGKTVAESTN